jgi:transposase
VAEVEQSIAPIFDLDAGISLTNLVAVGSPTCRSTRTRVHKMLFPDKFVPQRASKFEDNLLSYAPPELLVLFALGLFVPGGLFEYALSKRYLIVGGVGLLVWTPFLWSLLILIHNAVRGGVGAGVFIEFLKRLVYGQRRPIYLIVDGHPSHRSKKVKAYVESLKGKLRSFFLPPYSPELNPDELVRNDVKNNGVGRALVHGPTGLMRAVVGRLRYRQKTPRAVRSFFQHPETRYAACM